MKYTYEYRDEKKHTELLVSILKDRGYKEGIDYTTECYRSPVFGHIEYAVKMQITDEEMERVDNVFNWAKKTQALMDAIVSFLNSTYNLIFNRKGVNNHEMA